MFMRVIPLYINDNEFNEFMSYIEYKGFSCNKLCGKALSRYNDTEIGIFKFHCNPFAPECVAEELKRNTNLVMNFAHPSNKDSEGITKHLRIGKIFVDWLNDWRSRSL